MFNVIPNLRFNCRIWQNHQTIKHGIDFGKRFVCPECKEVLPSDTQLRAHLVRKHDNVASTCHICNKVLKGKAGLLKHIKNAHFRTNPQVCENLFNFYDIDIIYG